MGSGLLSCQIQPVWWSVRRGGQGALLGVQNPSHCALGPDQMPAGLPVRPQPVWAPDPEALVIFKADSKSPPCQAPRQGCLLETRYLTESPRWPIIMQFLHLRGQGWPLQPHQHPHVDWELSVLPNPFSRTLPGQGGGRLTSGSGLPSQSFLEAHS